MFIDAEQVAAWIGKNLAHEQGALPVDYVSINRRATSRSWPQHARVEAAGRPPLEVIAEVQEHLDDLGHNAAAEGLATYSVRLLLYRASGIPAGSRTFRAEVAHAGERLDDDDTDGTLQGELVATVRELRLLVRDQGQQIERASGLGYKLASDALHQASQLQMENAGLMVAIAEAQSDTGTSKSQQIAELVSAVLPALPALLQAGAQRQAGAAAAEAAAAEAGDLAGLDLAELASQPAGGSSSPET